MNIKKILLSVVVIGAVSALAIGGTIAYFSDTETSVGNTISAGVIDISVDGENPWSKKYSDGLQDLKPGEVKDIQFTVKNEGQNPVVLRKMVSVTATADGVTTEPECQEAAGTWDGAAKTCAGGTQNNDLSKAMIYSMTITPEGGSPIVIIPETADVRVNEVASLWVPLGTVPAGKTLTVKQSYRLAAATTNWAQGDSMTFDMTLYAEQKAGEGTPTSVGVVVDNKSGDPDWYSVTDGKLGILNRDGTSYAFNAFGLTASQPYHLVYATTPFSTFTLLAAGTSDASGNLTLSGTNLPASLNGKIWLLSGASGWGTTSENLWEANLINY